MAVLSDVKKYMIDGVEIPVYPTSVVPSHNLVSKSWNDMYGIFKDIPVNSKLKINWIFDVVSEHNLETLWGKLIYNKIVTKNSRFFEINTFFPGLGFIRGTFYLGTPTSFTSRDWQSGDGSVNFWQCEIHWIEVDGIKLNSPIQAAPVSIRVNSKKINLKDNSLTDVLKNNVKG